MRSLTPTAWRAGGFIVTAVVMLLIVAVGPKSGYGQNILKTIPGYGMSKVCNPNGECCVLFEFQTAVSSDELDITLTGGTDDGCFDWTCFTNQTGGSLTFIHTGVGKIKITFTGGTFPDPFDFYLCCTDLDGCMPACMNGYTWTSYYQGTQSGTGVGSLYTGCCVATEPPCGDCDQTWQSSTNEICFEKGSPGGSAQCVTIFFDPGVSCLPSGVTQTGCTNPFIFSSSTGVPGNYTSFTFCEPNPPVAGCPLEPCQALCITFPPECNMGRITHFWGTTDVSDAPCGEGTGVLKRTTSQSNSPLGSSAHQNFPNPLDAATGFNTTIPFVTSAGGVATINIVNVKGDRILNDAETLLGPGTHFFYFSAKDLPSGTYYYTIEFPKGVAIANKTMLVVK